MYSAEWKEIHRRWQGEGLHPWRTTGYGDQEAGAHRETAVLWGSIFEHVNAYRFFYLFYLSSLSIKLKCQHTDNSTIIGVAI
jgi:hypothetical protein